MGEAQADKGTSQGVPVESSYYSRPEKGGYLHQGQLLRRVWEWVAKYDGDGKPIRAEARVRKLAVIVTQECDLTQDFGIRKDNAWAETDLLSVLLCPALPAEELRSRHEITRKRWEVVRSNGAERYQYLAGVPTESDAEATGHDPMLVDFKSYFAVRTVELYRQIRTANEKSASLFTVLNVPWREHIQQRFAVYQSRVGLPLDHFIPESRRDDPTFPPA